MNNFKQSAAFLLLTAAFTVLAETVNKENDENLPVFSITREQTDNKIIEDTGDYILVQSYNVNSETVEIEQTDQQIDQMVYQLYGLTDEEIAIVEGS